MNNETIGISAEVAIAKAFDVKINKKYERRADSKIVKKIKKYITKAFDVLEIPRPINHCAENQNPVDFLLKKEKTLSVKTNTKKFGKSAPQKVGQPTSKTYFEKVAKAVKVEPRKAPEEYEDRVKLFKKISTQEIKKVLTLYWKHFFSCDYMIYISNINSKKDIPNFIMFKKASKSPEWEEKEITFTRGLDKWNKGTTVKYFGVSLGEFQIHKNENRDCFEFRFNVKGLIKLIEMGKIKCKMRTF